MPKLTLEQKRRETLRRQLYGREVTTPKSAKNPATKSNNSAASAKTYSLSDYQPTTGHSESLSANYLAHDLTKILIFSVIAIAVQLTLFFLTQHNFVKLPF